MTRIRMASVGAVFAGLVAVVVLSTVTDQVLHATGAYGPSGAPLSHGGALLALAHRTAWTLLGGWLTARLAPERPLAHAVALGVVGTGLGTLGALGALAAGPELGPLWYPVALALLALPQCAVGGMLHRRSEPSLAVG